MQEDGPAIEAFLLEMKAEAMKYLPCFSFLIGILLTYLVFQILPGYNERCSKINKSLHAPRSVVELLDHKVVPGEYPITTSRRLIDEIKSLVSAKEKEILALKKNLEQEDQELVDLIAEKDEEIAQCQTSLQQKDQEISNLQSGQKLLSIQTLCTVTPSPSKSLVSFDHEVQLLKGQLEAALACKAELQQQNTRSARETEMSKKISSRRTKRHASPPSSLTKGYLERINTLESQLTRRTHEVAEAQQIAAGHENRLSDLQAQLAKHDAEGSVVQAQSTINPYVQRVSDLEAEITRLTQHELDLVNSQKLASTQHVQHDQQVDELKAQLTELTQRILNLDNEQPSDCAEHIERIAHLEAQVLNAAKYHTDLEAQASANCPKHVEQIHDLEAKTTQLTQQNLELARAMKTNSAKHVKQVKDLDARITNLTQENLDLASSKQSLSTQHFQQIDDLKIELARRELDVANAQHSGSIQCQGQSGDLQAQVSRINLELANAQQTNVTLHNQLNSSQFSLAEVTRNFNKRTERLTYLESQCVKADDLYAHYLRQREEIDQLRQITTTTTTTTDNVQALESELGAANQQIANLSHCKQQLDYILQNQLSADVLHQIALDDKDKELAHARQQLQAAMDSFRESNAPSAGILKHYEALKQDLARSKDWEGRFYGLEKKMGDLKASERSLGLQLERCRAHRRLRPAVTAPATPTHPTQAPATQAPSEVAPAVSEEAPTAVADDAPAAVEEEEAPMVMVEEESSMVLDQVAPVASDQVPPTPQPTGHLRKRRVEEMEDRDGDEWKGREREGKRPHLE